MSKKISELTELLTPANADLLPIVDDTDSTTKKITWQNLLAGISGFPAFNNVVYVDSSIGTSGGGASLIFDTIANAMTYIGTQSPSTSNRFGMIVHSKADTSSFAIENFVSYFSPTKCACSGAVDHTGSAANFATIFLDDLPSVEGFIFEGQVDFTNGGQSGGGYFGCTFQGGLDKDTAGDVNFFDCNAVFIGSGNWGVRDLEWRGGLFLSAAGSTMTVTVHGTGARFQDVRGFAGTRMEFSTTAGSTVTFRNFYWTSGTIANVDAASENVDFVWIGGENLGTLELSRSATLRLAGHDLSALTTLANYVGTINLDKGSNVSTFSDGVSPRTAGINFNGYTFERDEEAEKIATTGFAQGSGTATVLNITGSVAADPEKRWSSWTITQDSVNGLDIEIHRDGEYEIFLPIEWKISTEQAIALTKNTTSDPTATALEDNVLYGDYQASAVATRNYRNIDFHGRLSSGDVLRINVIGASNLPEDLGDLVIRRTA